MVTGAATGLGAAAVRALTAAGAGVVATYHHTEPDDTADATWLQCDARDAAAVNAMMDAAVSELGGLDVLVNAAGLWQQGIPGMITAEDIDFVVGTNLKTTIFTNQAAHAAMRKTGGRIINFGSAEAVTGSPISAVYAAAKGAVQAWTRSAAKAWASDRVTVNALAPTTKTTTMTTLQNTNATTISIQRRVQTRVAGQAEHFGAGPLGYGQGQVGLGVRGLAVRRHRIQHAATNAKLGEIGQQCVAPRCAHDKLVPHRLHPGCHCRQPEL